MGVLPRCRSPGEGEGVEERDGAGQGEGSLVDVFEEVFDGDVGTCMAKAALNHDVFSSIGVGSLLMPGLVAVMGMRMLNFVI